MMLKAILCVQHLAAMLFILDLFIKTDSTVICVPRMLEHVCYEPFSSKNCRFKGYLMLIGCIFALSEIRASKTRFKQINENLRLNVYARMFWEHVYKSSYPQYCHKQLRKIGRFTYRFFMFSCESVFTRKRNPSHDLLSSFLTLIWIYQYLFILWK